MNARDKHHSWAELYFDLVFVFAAGQLTHLIVATPEWASVLLALVLFVMLWWTWIGFVVHYNRHGEDRPAERLYLIAGTVPCAIAAIQIHGASVGHLTGFALALAGGRVVLALAHLSVVGEGRPVGRRVGAAYLVSAAALAVSAFLPPVAQFAAWAAVLVLEATSLLRSATPAGEAFAVNARHLAERFNLFMIIVLGEVVISVSAAAAGVHGRQTGYWLGLFSGLVLAGALWWIYFDSAADINATLLRGSGGNPALAYGIYAMGYLLPTFAALLLAAGCALALQESPPAAATWLVTLGLAAYLVGIRGFVAGRRGRHWHLFQVTVIAATISIALLNRVLAGAVVVAVAAIWSVIVATAMTRRARRS